MEMNKVFGTSSGVVIVLGYVQNTVFQWRIPLWSINDTLLLMLAKTEGPIVASGITKAFLANADHTVQTFVFDLPFALPTTAVYTRLEVYFQENGATIYLLDVLQPQTLHDNTLRGYRYRVTQAASTLQVCSIFAAPFATIVHIKLQ